MQSRALSVHDKIEGHAQRCAGIRTGPESRNKLTWPILALRLEPATLRHTKRRLRLAPHHVAGFAKSAGRPWYLQSTLYGVYPQVALGLASLLLRHVAMSSWDRSTLEACLPQVAPSSTLLDRLTASRHRRQLLDLCLQADSGTAMRQRGIGCQPRVAGLAATMCRSGQRQRPALPTAERRVRLVWLL